MNYYNENDPKAAAWLRELIAAGELPPGTVDERSIADVRKSDLEGYTQFHTFCGIGGWPLALKFAGWPDEWPVWTGSCPCQPFSQSGAGQVDKDERHVWPAFRAAIAECRPPILFGEQVASKDGRIWLAGVRADLEALGYGFGASDICAASVGAPHIRQRLYWMAYAHGSRPLGTGTGTQGERREALRSAIGGSDGRVADTASGGLGINGSASRECGHADFRGETVGMGNANGAGSQPRESPSASARHRCSTESDGSIDRVGDTDGSRSQGRGLLSGNDTRQRTPWEAGFEVVRCTDGKTRKFERGTFPLVNGIPGRVVQGGDLSVPEIQNTKEGRVMRLRGYGNAIVPQLAAQFILACMDVLRFDLVPCDSKTQ